MVDERKLPLGRIARLARLAATGARTGTGLLLTPRRAEELADTAAEALGTLRGLAAKTGQMASYIDGMVPADLQPAFEKGMASLRAAAPTSDPVVIRDTVETELGAPIDRLFASFEGTPFASASIGQVHRATLHDGRAVAVKVQHPGIDRAVESDLANASTVESMVRVLGAGKLGSKTALQEIRARFREELDYAHEADQQRWFSAFHRDDLRIVVPAVIGERSSRRVLTTERVDGLTLEEAAEADEPARAEWCRTLWRFVFRALLVGGRFNADPHPGNYFFQDDGRIAFIDFGCVQRFEDPYRLPSLDAHHAAAMRDEASFADAVRRLLGTRGGTYETHAIAYSRMLFEPLFAPPFRITRDYVAAIVKETTNVKRSVIFGRNARFVPLPPGMLFVNRLQFGFYSVLARLDAEVDYTAEERTILAEAQASLAGGSGETTIR